MSRIRVILWDIDGTILNFGAAQEHAIRKCFETFGLGMCTDEMLQDYDGINHRHWQALERGEITKQQVLEGRFHEFFRKYGIPETCIPEFNREYQVRLGDTICFYPHALETLRACKEAGILQYAVTNGTKTAQDRKLRRSGLIDILDAVFISDEIGAEKPSHDFFIPVFRTIAEADPSITREQVMIVGDSLTSDMPGGQMEGIVTCWFRHPGQENRILHPDHTIGDLAEVPALAGIHA